MTDEIDKLLGITPPSSGEAHSENREGHIQKHKTRWVFLGWILVIAGGYFLFQGFANYADASNPDLIRALESMAAVSDAAARARENQGLPRLDYGPPVDMMAEASRLGLIGGALSIVGLGLAFGGSVFRCSECGAKVAMKTAKICPSCGATFSARK